MEQFEPSHGQILAPSEAHFCRPPKIILEEEYLQFRIGDIPRKVDDSLPSAPYTRQVIVIKALLPRPIFPRALVQIEGQVSRQGGVERDGPGYAQGCESQVHDVAAPQVLRYVRPDIDVKAGERILPRVVDGYRRLVGFDAAPALPSGFPAARTALLFIGRFPAEEAEEETETGRSWRRRRRRRRRGGGGGGGRHGEDRRLRRCVVGELYVRSKLS